MNNKMRKELRKKMHAGTKAVQIGKSGLSETMIKEIKRQLKLNKTVKVKFLKSVPTSPGHRNEIIHKIVEETGAMLLTHTGSVILLHKP